MARPRKAAPQAASNKKTRYFILDANAEQIAGQNVTAKHREEGIELTEQEAIFYTASGTIGTEDPRKSKGAQRAVAAAEGEVGFPDNTKAIKDADKAQAKK